MNLKDRLLVIRSELVEKNKESIFNEGVLIKLGRSECNYQKNIEENCRYILSRNNYKTIMAIDRYNKQKEKRNEKENKYGFVEVIKPSGRLLK